MIEVCSLESSGILKNHFAPSLLQEDDFTGAIQLCLECQKVAATYRYFTCIRCVISSLSAFEFFNLFFFGFQRVEHEAEGHDDHD